MIVTGSTAQFHSRAERYARTCVARGHEVTLVAQWRPGLPVDEEVSGYRVLRPPVRTIDGLPFGRRLRPVLSRLGGGRGPSWAADPWAIPARAAAPPTVPAPGAALPSRAALPAPGAVLPRPAGRARTGLAWLVGRARLPLSIRALRIAASAVAPPADVHVGMSFAAIPVALALGRRDRAKVVYDIGDVYLEARNLARLRGPARWLVARAERGWARRSDVLITANGPYADLLETRLGAGRPEVILNTPPRYVPPPVPPRRFHERLGLAGGTAVVLFHGGLVEERGIEQLAAAIADVPGAVLVLMGYGTLVPWLESVAADPATNGRVRLLPAVPPAELVDWVASADVVAMPIQPTTLNHRFTTPNRLWEAIAAGVPILAADLPGMAPVVREIDGGVLVDPTDPRAIAEGLRALLALPASERAAMRGRLLAAAADRYCWEVEEVTWLRLLSRLTGRPW